MRINSLYSAHNFFHPTYPKGGGNSWASILGQGIFCVLSGELTKDMIAGYFREHFEKAPNNHFDFEAFFEPAIVGLAGI